MTKDFAEAEEARREVAEGLKFLESVPQYAQKAAQRIVDSGAYNIEFIDSGELALGSNSLELLQMQKEFIEATAKGEVPDMEKGQRNPVFAITSDYQDQVRAAGERDGYDSEELLRRQEIYTGVIIPNHPEMHEYGWDLRIAYLKVTKHGQEHQIEEQRSR